MLWLFGYHCYILRGDENLYHGSEIANTAFSFIVFFIKLCRISVAIGRNCLLPFITFYSLARYNQQVWNVLLSIQYGNLLKHSYFETNSASNLIFRCTASQKYYFASWVRKHVTMFFKRYSRLYGTRPLANQIYTVDSQFHSPKKVFFPTDFKCWFGSFMQAIDSSSVHAILLCR